MEGKNKNTDIQWFLPIEVTKKIIKIDSFEGGKRRIRNIDVGDFNHGSLSIFQCQYSTRLDLQFSIIHSSSTALIGDLPSR